MNTFGDPSRARDLVYAISDWPALTVDRPHPSGLTLPLDGNLWPLDGFMGRKGCERCRRDLRLPNGNFWPRPVVVDVSAAATR